jgi:hypothetical protein
MVACVGRTFGVVPFDGPRFAQRAAEFDMQLDKVAGAIAPQNLKVFWLSA